MNHYDSKYGIKGPKEKTFCKKIRNLARISVDMYVENDDPSTHILICKVSFSLFFGTFILIY